MTSDEFSPLPPESTPPECEYYPLPPEFDSVSFTPVSGKRGGIASKIKAYFLTAAVSVTAITGATQYASRPSAPAAPEVKTVSAAEYVSDYELAFYARSGEQAEKLAERELWCRLFDGSSEENSPAKLPGVFADENVLSHAFTRDTVYYTDDLEPLSLPYYKYTLDLPEGRVEGKIHILPERESFIVRLSYKGEESLYLLSASEPTLSAPYDVSVDNYGRSIPEVSVFGNGVRIVSFLRDTELQSSLCFCISNAGVADSGLTPLDLTVTVTNPAP